MANLQDTKTYWVAERYLGQVVGWLIVDRTTGQVRQAIRYITR